MEDFWKSIQNYFNNFLYDGGITIVRTLAFALLGLVILKIVRMIVRRVALKSKLDNAAATFIISMITVVLYIALVIVVVSSLGISTAGIIAAFSAVALAVALALKDSLASLANGVIIIFTKPFKKGDTIMINGQEGTVQDIRLFNTKILTFNNEEVIIPNSDVLSETLVNESNRPLRRVELPFYISYTADANKVRSEVLRRMEESDQIINSPAPAICFDTFGELTVKCTAYAWAPVEAYFDAKNAVREIIYAVIRENKAEPSARRVLVDYDGAATVALLPEMTDSADAAANTANTANADAATADKEADDE